METEHKITGLVDHLFREESGKIVAVLTRIFGFSHSSLVEDIVQDTFITALKRWRHSEIPDRPSAWLMGVAKNKTLNALKRKNRSVSWDQLGDISKLANEESLESHIDTLFLDHEIRDSQLRMLFACCDPQFSEKAQIVLTLKTLCGFSNSEIERALLMSKSAVKKMLYRSRKSLREDTQKLDVPFVNQLNERLQGVHTVLYLMFNEGYKRYDDDSLVDVDLCIESVRLTKELLKALSEHKGETHALLALFYFCMSRFNARISQQGEQLDLKEQDRSLWNKELIKLGFHHMKKSRQSESLTQYHLEAGINSVHCSAPSNEETDWNAIVDYYDLLQELTDSPVVQINRAIALSYKANPEAGLEALEQIDQRDLPDKYYLFHATKADFHFRLGNFELARSYYRVAVDLAKSKPDIASLKKRIKQCDRKNINDN